jgi:hypothetical protein
MESDPSSSNLQDKIRRRLETDGTTEKVTKILETAFADAVDGEHIVLRYDVKKRLQSSVLKELLARISQNL